jgi:hypothetical protein
VAWLRPAETPCRLLLADRAVTAKRLDAFSRCSQPLVGVMMGPASEGRSAAAGSCPRGGVVARDRAGAMPVRQRVSETGVPEMGVPAMGVPSGGGRVVDADQQAHASGQAVNGLTRLCTVSSVPAPAQGPCRGGIGRGWVGVIAAVHHIFPE